MRKSRGLSRTQKKEKQEAQKELNLVDCSIMKSIFPTVLHHVGYGLSKTKISSGNTVHLEHHRTTSNAGVHSNYRLLG